MSLALTDTLRRTIGNYLNTRSIRTYRSRLGRHAAPRYQAYWDACRADFKGSLPDPGSLAQAIAEFRVDGVTSFVTAETTRVARTVAERLAGIESAGRAWGPETGYGSQNYIGNMYLDFPEIEDLFRNDVGTFLMHYFGCDFKLFYGSLYRSHAEIGSRRGSQLWHSDGGPGSCVNVMFYLHETDEDSGTLEALPWKEALEIYERENAAMQERGHGGVKNRDALCQWYGEEINAKYADRVQHATGPAGLVVPFLNNTLHRGGYPTPGRTRTAIVFHCYPSHQPPSFEQYRKSGIRKAAPYPADPAATF